jgi:hypothetical protein
MIVRRARGWGFGYGEGKECLETRKVRRWRPIVDEGDEAEMVWLTVTSGDTEYVLLVQSSRSPCVEFRFLRLEC